MVGIHGVGSSPRPLVAARKATDRLGDQMTQARHAREKARVLRDFPDGRPDDDAASREAPQTCRVVGRGEVKGGAYAPPALRKSNSGMPIALALSARLSVTPEPGNTTMPIGNASSS